MYIWHTVLYNTGLEINFEESDYSIEEGATLSNDIRIQFRNNQNQFNITLTPVDIDTAEHLGLGFFINSDDIQITKRADAGKGAYVHVLSGHSGSKNSN